MARKKKSTASASPPWNKVAIFGLGLIGGSIAMALKQRKLAGQIVRVGKGRASVTKAIKQGVIDASLGDIEEAVGDADLVIVATPPSTVVETVQRAAEHTPPGCLITDAASVKGDILTDLKKQLPKQVSFVGSHPMAGGHATGWEHGSADLFEDRTTIVCPMRSPDPAVGKICRLWESLGSNVVKFSGRQHDQLVATISHMPHLVASALAQTLRGKAKSVVGPGWLDTTRIAQADPSMWVDIFFQNRKNVLSKVQQFQQRLATLATALEVEDKQKLAKLLSTGKAVREQAAALAD